MNLKLFELYNRKLIILVNDPRQFDYNSIRDDHKWKAHIQGDPRVWLVEGDFVGLGFFVLKILRK